MQLKTKLLSRYTIFSITCFSLFLFSDFVKSHHPDFYNMYWSLVIAGIVTYFMLVIENSGR